jgi:hypothetical protein
MMFKARIAIASFFTEERKLFFIGIASFLAKKDRLKSRIMLQKKTAPNE